MSCKFPTFPLKTNCHTRSLTLAALFLGLSGFEVDGGKGADELHGLGLNQHGVLLVPARPLQVQALDVHAVL